MDVQNLNIGLKFYFKLIFSFYKGEKFKEIHFLKMKNRYFSLFWLIIVIKVMDDQKLKYMINLLLLNCYSNLKVEKIKKSVLKI